MNTRRGTRVVVVLASALALLAGCGGDDDTSEAATTAGADAGATTAVVSTGAPGTTGAVDQSDLADYTHLATAPTAGGVTSVVVDGSNVVIDVGDGKTIRVPKDMPLKIAVMTYGLGLKYQAATVEGAKAAAEKYGATIDIFDSEFDTTKQREQIESVAQSGDYNAVLLEPLDPTSCELAKELVAKNLLVSVWAIPLCGRDQNHDDDLWEPGTITYVGGPAQLDTYTEFAKYVAGLTDEPTEALVVTGQVGQPAADSIVTAVGAASAEHPNFNVVATDRGDYTTQTAFNNTENLLRANPNVSVIITNSGEITAGVVQAVKEVGASDRIKIYSTEANRAQIELVESGDVEAVSPMYPYSNAFTAVEALAAVVAGHSVPRAVLNDGQALPPGSSTINVITKDNLSTYVPEY
jgi:ribose transport system substrate-binding protein